MRDRIFTAGEILTIQTNMKEIEKNLGYPVPRGLLDVSELSEHILRPGEVMTYCQNIRNISGTPRYSGGSIEDHIPSPLAISVGAAILICVILELVEIIFGVTIL